MASSSFIAEGEGQHLQGLAGLGNVAKKLLQKRKGLLLSFLVEVYSSKKEKKRKSENKTTTTIKTLGHKDPQ